MTSNTAAKDPKTFNLAADDPKTSNLVVDDPKTFNLAADDPKTSNLAADDPKTSNSAADDPKTSNSGVEDPKTNYIYIMFDLTDKWRNIHVKISTIKLESILANIFGIQCISKYLICIKISNKFPIKNQYLPNKWPIFAQYWTNLASVRRPSLKGYLTNI